MIEVFDLSRATDLDKQKLPIQTVNGVEPDAEGDVKIDVGVKTVNGAAPDEAGAVNIEIGATEADIIAAADKALASYTAGTGQVDLTAALSAVSALEAKVARCEAQVEDLTAHRFAAPDYANKTALSYDTDFTVPENGFIERYFQYAETGGATMIVTINGTAITYKNDNYGGDYQVIPVLKGDVIKYSVTRGNCELVFMPARY